MRAAISWLARWRFRTKCHVYAVFSIFVGSWYPAGYPTLAKWYTCMIGITVISVISGIPIYANSQRTRRGKIGPVAARGGGEE
jgi:hypothetical protein